MNLRPALRYQFGFWQLVLVTDNGSVAESGTTAETLEGAIRGGQFLLERAGIYSVTIPLERVV